MRETRHPALPFRGPVRETRGVQQHSQYEGILVADGGSSRAIAASFFSRCMSGHILSFLLFRCPLCGFRVASCHVISGHAMALRVRSCHLFSFLVSCHVVSGHSRIGGTFVKLGGAVSNCARLHPRCATILPSQLPV